MDTARIWALLYSRKGDNSQVLALARSLGLPFEAKPLRYNRLRAIGRWLGPGFVTLDQPSRLLLAPPWPDAVVAIGRWSVPVAQAIKRRSGGHTRIIFLGNPRVGTGGFDLVVATRDYVIPTADNVMVAPLPIVESPTSVQVGTPVPAMLADLPHPRRLVLIGGPVKYWKLTGDEVGLAIARLARTVNQRGGSIVVSASPRTPDALLDSARRALAGVDYGHVVSARQGGLAALYACADEIFVTGDSMTMITEAILTGKPVGLLPLTLSSKGQRRLGPTVATDGPASKRRDLRRFWSELWASGLAGTLARPIAAPLAQSTASADRVAANVLALIPASPGLRQVSQPDLSLAGLTVRFGQLLDDTRRTVGTWSLAARDRQTPWYAKLVAATSAMLAISPVDFTPDSIPGIGHLDDPILLILGTLLAVGFVPSSLRADLHRRATQTDRQAANHGALAIFLLWAVAGLRFARLVF